MFRAGQLIGRRLSVVRPHRAPPWALDTTVAALAALALVTGPASLVIVAGAV
ncbi:hypothetical protein [Agromyces bauzanensis]|uniref:hypothetical protein n=1 Tax=Agromyces bauzanensis TaxID=1308924 RepID=UPI001665310A|nr:hypothetical protein [Agromyces bauzanensis]